ncbi:PQQ-like beta-propeller repeat protein [Brevundimonas terrae]|uniref:PQQ-like beta-propeller repeat protein n=1 Tax=Brevundimonas terrae TaxID=363631 RepID=A0ABN0YHX9_9CAUL|nr:PQQ-like beta-propeller repeat protein [Brevundimonas terrae]NIJ27139.1 outer membrane protein assembly factor BamB [Brevundimonas terrae]
MNRSLKIVLMCGLAATVASCGTVKRALPFLDKEDGPKAVATQGERVSILEFEQQLAPSPALSGRDFFVPGPQAVTAWTQPGMNAESETGHVIAAPEFTVAWRRDIGASSDRMSQVMAPPVAADGRIFVMDGEAAVSAVDAASGSVIWKKTVGIGERDAGRRRFGISLGGGSSGGGFGGGVAVADNKVFVASGYRSVTALNAATGEVVWTHETDLPIHNAPTVSGGRVYVIDVDNQLIALDMATGNQNWTYRGITEPARIMRATSVTVSGDTVVAPFSSGQVVALRAANGQPVWEEVLSRTSRTNALSELRDIAGRPVISRGFVYAISQSGVMQSLDIRTGAPRWELPIGGVNAPLPVGDVVYVVSKTGELTVVNRETGQIYWTRDLNDGRIRTEGGWFFGMGKRTVRPSWSGPVLASNRLVLVNSEGQMVAFDPKTGQQTASIDLGSPAYIAPAAYNGALYVVTDDARLISIR